MHKTQIDVIVTLRKKLIYDVNNSDNKKYVDLFLSLFMLKFRISSKTLSYHVDCKDKINGLDNNFRDNITYLSSVNETEKMVHYNCNKLLII